MGDGETLGSLDEGELVVGEEDLGTGSLVGILPQNLDVVASISSVLKTNSFQYQIV